MNSSEWMSHRAADLRKKAAECTDMVRDTDWKELKMLWRSRRRGYLLQAAHYDRTARDMATFIQPQEPHHGTE